MLLARAIRFSFLFSSSFFPKWLIFLQAGIQLTNDSLSLSGSATGWRWRQRLLMLRGGKRGDWTQSHVKGQRAASPQGARSTHKGPWRASMGAGGATKEERPRWEPKLTAQTLLMHWGFGCLWPPGGYTHLSVRSCQLHAVEPQQLQIAAHWAQKQQKH